MYGAPRYARFTDDLIELAAVSISSRKGTELGW
jgi:hypothetical protein